MAKFLDLATELVLTITSHIPRSADKLQLALANRKLYHLVLPQLYKHIVLCQAGDPINRGEPTQIRGDSCWDTVRLRRLCTELMNRSSSRKLVVESLDLELESNTFHESFELSSITLYLPRLKSLCITSKRLAGLDGGQKPSFLSPLLIGRRLRNVSETLESLIIDIDQDMDYLDGSCIGSLGHYNTLKHLGIQSHIFLGEHVDGFIRTQGDDDDETIEDDTILAALLPRNLQKLQLSCWADEEQEDEYVSARVIAILLRGLMKCGLDFWPELQDITVYYPIKHGGAQDMESEIPPDVAQAMEVDKLAIVRRSLEGQWQKVGDMLTEMALSEHRSISVKYKQGSQSGSRAWGETATEPAIAESGG